MGNTHLFLAASELFQNRRHGGRRAGFLPVRRRFHLEAPHLCFRHQLQRAFEHELRGDLFNRTSQPLYLVEIEKQRPEENLGVLQRA